MSRPHRIIELGLEKLVLALLAEGCTRDQIQERCNSKLKGQGLSERVSVSALNRYLASLDKAAVPALHQPQIAEQSFEIMVNVGERVTTALTKLDALCSIAETERDRLGERQYSAIVALTAESRKQVKLYVDLLDKLYSAQRIAIFQQAVLDAIDEADPDVAARVRENLRRHHEIRRAALLGA